MFATEKSGYGGYSRLKEAAADLRGGRRDGRARDTSLSLTLIYII
jgi:hypothetical protein